MIGEDVSDEDKNFIPMTRLEEVNWYGGSTRFQIAEVLRLGMASTILLAATRRHLQSGVYNSASM